MGWKWDLALSSNWTWIQWCTYLRKIICYAACIRHKQEMFVLLGHKQDDEQQAVAVKSHEDILHPFEWIESQIWDCLCLWHQWFNLCLKHQWFKKILFVQSIRILKRKRQDEFDCHWGRHCACKCHWKKWLSLLKSLTETIKKFKWAKLIANVVRKLRF